MAGHVFTASAFRNGEILAVDARSTLTFSRHSHDAFGVGLMTCGAQRSWSGRGMVEASRGDHITVNPGEVHDGMPIGSDRAWSMLYFTPEVVSTVMADLSEGKVVARELHAPIVTEMRAVRQFIAARTAVIASNEPAQGSDEHLISLFATLFRIKPQRFTAGPDRLNIAREWIDDDPLAQHSLSDLAFVCGLSRFQTVRGFAKLTGLTPRAYVIQRRLELARRAIRAGSTLVDAAIGSGFADQSHMNRAFVARYGMTPGAYVKAFAH